MSKQPPPPTLDSQIAELAAYGRVLGDDAGLVPAWGQEHLVDQLVKHVGRGRSFVVVGPPGCGKSHVLHNVARRLREASPPWLVLETSTSEVMTDTKYIGEWETKLKNVVSRCLGDKRVVLLFTDINSVVTQGATVQRDANFASYLQPHIERGELVVAGETTAREMQLGLLRLPGFARLVAPFGLLKVEEGLHRFEGKDKRPPTMVRVEILPVADGARQVARRDVRIDRTSRGGRIEMVATHAPSGVAVEASVDGSELDDEAVFDWLEARVHRPARDLDRVVRRYGVEGKFAEDEATGERIGHKDLAAGGLDELLRARLYM